ncbi:hypothetical protein LEP1GSC161_3502 [Leptospira santarosai str. CBC1416]|uniref:Uncharacterized protein n=1 Tax=Leptospira santarosai str. CBC1416 TaxID=1193059 RepID=M6VQJ6_9LEPT|nr:hypothetical protein LEP1GSC161_3502 [Leptospira santarosai str. CBC1416]
MYFFLKAANRCTIRFSYYELFNPGENFLPDRYQRFFLYSPHRLLYLLRSCIVLLSEVNLGFCSFIRVVFPF